MLLRLSDLELAYTGDITQGKITPALLQEMCSRESYGAVQVLLQRYGRLSDHDVTLLGCLLTHQQAYQEAEVILRYFAPQEERLHMCQQRLQDFTDSQYALRVAYSIAPQRLPTNQED